MCTFLVKLPHSFLPSEYIFPSTHSLDNGKLRAIDMLKIDIANQFVLG